MQSTLKVGIKYVSEFIKMFQTVLGTRNAKWWIVEVIGDLFLEPTLKGLNTC